MSAGAIARLREKVTDADIEHAGFGLDTSEVEVAREDLRALLDAHATLEAAHTEALDALEKLCAAQKHVLEVRCAGDDEYMAACDGAESILAKAGRR